MFSYASKKKAIDLFHDRMGEKMKEKIKKRIEGQLKKIEKYHHFVNYYDINSLRECYIILNECLDDLDHMYQDYNFIDRINFNIKVSNTIIKNNKELL